VSACALAQGSGVGEALGVSVAVGVAVALPVAVAVLVAVAAAVAVAVDVTVGVKVAVAVLVAVAGATRRHSQVVVAGGSSEDPQVALSKKPASVHVCWQSSGAVRAIAICQATARPVQFIVAPQDVGGCSAHQR
jgi:hypothetical protein